MFQSPPIASADVYSGVEHTPLSLDWRVVALWSRALSLARLGLGARLTVGNGEEIFGGCKVSREDNIGLFPLGYPEQPLDKCIGVGSGSLSIRSGTLRGHGDELLMIR